MNKESKANMFVCPNDRQLSLRAKLRSGWSAARSCPPLSAAERAAVAAVVRRAELLDDAEQRRVARLVARVEGMRRAAAGAAAAGCALCGERARLLAPLRTCVACRGNVCRTCVAEHVPQSAHRQQPLCALCWETRELWRRSGAWFYRGLPRPAPPARAASAQDSSSAESRPSSEPGSPGSAGAGGALARPPSRQSSRRGSRKSLASPHEAGEAWGEAELSHGVSALSLQRAGSRGSAHGPRPRRDPAAAAAADTVIPDAGWGTLELTLSYDGAALALAAAVRRARGLVGTDAAGLADVYCRLEVLPREGSYSNSLRTKTVHKTRNPEFNETLHFFGVTASDLESRSLRAVLYDDDLYGCEEMGSALVALRECARAPTPLRLALGPPARAAPAAARLLLGLCYSTRRRALLVTVGRAAALPPRDANGYSDPFVKLHLEPDPCHKKHKTTIKWRNLNPVWNEEFAFDTRPTELSRQNLKLTVWDKDYGKANDFLGCLAVGAASKGPRLKHWMDCIRYPDHRHEQWHALTDTRV